MNIYEKLCKMQNELKAPKNEYNKFGDFSYRTAEGILQAVKPLCEKHETTLLLTDSVEVVEGKFFIKTIAELISWDFDNETVGKVVSVSGWAEFPSLKAKTDEAQRTGIASSYAKKRALESLFGLSNEKDSDAYDDTRAAEPEKPVEHWRIIENDVQIKGTDGRFYSITKMTKPQLEKAIKMKEYNAIKDLIQEVINTK